MEMRVAFVWRFIRGVVAMCVCVCGVRDGGYVCVICVWCARRRLRVCVCVWRVRRRLRV